nr:hypothetical protein [Tanacetum cinerariifolium]
MRFLNFDSCWNEVVTPSSDPENRTVSNKDEFGFDIHLGLGYINLQFWFPAQSIRSSNAIALDSPYLLVLITGASQSRQHDYEEIDGGYVAFEGNPKGGKIKRKGTIASDNACQARKETELVKDYILLSFDDEKKVDEDPRKEIECSDQEKEDNVNDTNNVNTISSTVNAASTNKDNELPFDPNMSALEDVSIFNFLNDDEDDERTQKGNSCIKRSKLDRGYAGRASRIQVT